MLYPVAQWLGLANSAVNPMVYAYFNKKFRHGEYRLRFRQNIHCLRPRNLVGSSCKLEKPLQFQALLPYSRAADAADGSEMTWYWPLAQDLVRTRFPRT